MKNLSLGISLFVVLYAVQTLWAAFTIVTFVFFPADAPPLQHAAVFFAQAFGALAFSALCAYGLFRMKPWARWLAIVIQIPSFVIGAGVAVVAIAANSPGLSLLVAGYKCTVPVVTWIYFFRPSTRQQFMPGGGAVPSKPVSFKKLAVLLAIALLAVYPLHRWIHGTLLKAGSMGSTDPDDPEIRQQIAQMRQEWEKQGEAFRRDRPKVVKLASTAGFLKGVTGFFVVSMVTGKGPGTIQDEFEHHMANMNDPSFDLADAQQNAGRRLQQEINTANEYARRYLKNAGLPVRETFLEDPPDTDAVLEIVRHRECIELSCNIQHQMDVTRKGEAGEDGGRVYEKGWHSDVSRETANAPEMIREIETVLLRELLDRLIEAYRSVNPVPAAGGGGTDET